MEIIKVIQKEWLGEATKYIQGGLHRTAYLFLETPVISVYRKSQVDEGVCNALGYEVLETYNNSSTIVLEKDTFLFGHFCPIDNGWYHRFIAYFVDWLKSKGLNAEFKDNDILVDGYKVCGMAITRYGRIDYTAGFIDINTNVDHIKAICRKPMKKVPKGLSEYGITTEEIEKMFLDFCGDDKT